VDIDITHTDEFVNFIRSYEGKGNIYLVGAGEFGKLIGKFLTVNGIKWQGYVDGYLKEPYEEETRKKINSYQDGFSENDYFVIASKVYADKMEEQLKAVNIKDENIIKFINIQDIVWNFSGAVEDWYKYLRKVQKFHNMYQGERCFVIGNGPSLTIKDLEKLKDEVTFASNSIYALYDRTEWRPTFYCSVDPVFYEQVLKEKEMILYLLSECQAAFTTANGNTRMFRDDAELERMFYIRARWSTDDKSGLPLFSNDCSKCYYASGTVAYLMLQLAVYMGFREIYLLGIDMSYSYKFYPDGTVDASDSYAEGLKQEQKSRNYETGKIFMITNETETHKKGYLAAYQYAKTNGIKIYNATRGGCLEVFERVDFDKLF